MSSKDKNDKSEDDKNRGPRGGSGRGRGPGPGQGFGAGAGFGSGFGGGFGQGFGPGPGAKFGRGQGFGHGPGHGPGGHGPGGRRGFFAPHGDSLAERSMGALMMTARMIRGFGESRIAQNEKFSKLSGPRIAVLFIVHHSGGIRMGDLAAKLQVAPRTVTDLVDGLERDGFLHRVPDPNDRRASLLELSDAAKNDFEHMTKMRAEFVEEIFSPLSDAEKETLMALLDKLREGPMNELLSEGFGRFRRF